MPTSLHKIFYSFIFFILALFFFWLTPDYRQLPFFTPIFQLLLVGWLVLAVVSGLKILKQSTSLSRIFIFLSCSIWLALAVLQHPGYVNFDTFSLQDLLGNGELSTWNTLMYSIIVKALFAADKSLFLLTLLHVFIFIGCLIKCIHISPLRKWWSLPLVIALTLLPLVQASVLYISRDNLFGLLVSYLLLCLAEKYFNKQSYNGTFILKTLLLTFVASEVRQDAKLLLLAYPFLIFTLDRSYPKLRKYLAVGALFAFSIAVNLGLLVKGLYVTNQHYQFTGVIHPINYIVHLRHDEIPSEQREAIQKVVDFDSLREYDPQSILPFHRGKFTLPVGLDDWRSFTRVYRDLVLKYPQDFITERFHVLNATFNLEGNPFIFPDEFEMTAELPQQVRARYQLQRWNFWPEFRQQHTHFLLNSMFYNNLCRILFGGPLVLFILAGALALWRSPFRLYYWVATLFYCSRFPVVFLMAPEPQLKYYAPMMFFPLFAILIFDWRHLRKQPANST